MDVFTSIDWNPSINDIIDDEFVSIDRLERESVMYKLLRGINTDPLENLHEDNYDLIKDEHIIYGKSQVQKDNAKRNEAKATLDNIVEPEYSQRLERPKLQAPQGKQYVPGIFKKPFHLPRTSNLTATQHAFCIKVLLKYSQSEKPKASATQEINDLQEYLNLQSIITKEQDEYLKVAKQNWNGSNINIVREDLINFKWNKKLKQLQTLHKYYNEIGSIPFNSQQEIRINFSCTALEAGTIPRLKLPISYNRNIINVNDPKISQRYFNDDKLNNDNNIYNDTNCQNLSKSHNIDFVISSSGLNCLATTLNPNHSNTWILPIFIEEHNSKNIIFVDKPLPNTVKNPIEKNTWIYKYILKNYVLRHDHKSTVYLNNKNINSDITTNSSETIKMSNNNIKKNAQYNIYTIGSCGTSQNELMKTKIEKDYKILVRTKIDAIEEVDNGMVAHVKLVAKLEHQTALGAEAVTVEEAAKQWISLTFTPNTYIIRVRIDQPTSEYLQIEKRTTSSINNEMYRLYNVKGENILRLLYNIIEIMQQMSPGRYILRHTPRNGAFATIYKETDSPGKNSINLDTIYCEDIFRTLPNAPWPLIDKTIPTPAAKFYNRMPAMFYPKLTNADRKKLNINAIIRQNKPKIINKKKKKTKNLINKDIE